MNEEYQPEYGPLSDSAPLDRQAMYDAVLAARQLQHCWRVHCEMPGCRWVSRWLTFDRSDRALNWHLRVRHLMSPAKYDEQLRETK